MLTQIWSGHTDIIFFFSFQTIFCSFAPLLIPKINIWKKYKKTPGDIILLYMCTINQDHMHPWYMMYGSWEIKFNRQVYFAILGNFLSFFSPNSPKTENFKKRKKSLEISSFNTNVPKIMIIWYAAPEIWHMADVIVIFHFGLFLPFNSLSSPKKSKSQ